MKNPKKYDFLFITPGFAPSKYRTQSFIDSLNKNYQYRLLNITKHNFPHANELNTFFRLASNKKSPLLRIFKEILVGIEISFRIQFIKFQRVYISLPPFISFLLIGFILTLQKKKLIVDMRDDYPEAFFQSGLLKKNGIIGKIVQTLTNFILKNSEIITVSNGIKNKLENQYRGKKITLFRNGFGENFFPNTKKFEEFTVVHHGTLGRFQDVELLIKISDYIQNHTDQIRFLIIGDGLKENLLIDSKLKNLEFVGKKSFKEIPEILAKCHLGLGLLTDDEIGKTAIPTKVYEYIGSGIPSIVSPIGEMSDFVIDNSLGFGFQNNEKEIGDKIIELSKNKDQYLNAVDNVIIKRKDFSRSANGKNIQELF